MVNWSAKLLIAIGPHIPFPAPTALNHTLYHGNLLQVFRNFSCRNMLCTFLCNYLHQVICCKSMWQVFFIFNLLFNFVISSSKFPDVSKNQNLCTPDFFKNTIHQSQCEPYDEHSFKKKNSFIKFFVSKKIGKRDRLFSCSGPGHTKAEYQNLNQW